MSGIFEGQSQIPHFYRKNLIYFFKANVSGLLINAYKVHSEYVVSYVKSQGFYSLKTNAKSGDPLEVVA